MIDGMLVRCDYTQKKRRKQYRIDLYSMARGHIITEKRFNKLTKKAEIPT